MGSDSSFGDVSKDDKNERPKNLNDLWSSLGQAKPKSSPTPLSSSITFFRVSKGYKNVSHVTAGGINGFLTLEQYYLSKNLDTFTMTWLFHSLFSLLKSYQASLKTALFL